RANDSRQPVEKAPHGRREGLLKSRERPGQLVVKRRPSERLQRRATEVQEARSVAGSSDGQSFRAGELCKIGLAGRLTQLGGLLIQTGIKACRSEKTCAVAGATDRGSFGRREPAEELISALGTQMVGKQDDQHEE